MTDLRLDLTTRDLVYADGDLQVVHTDGPVEEQQQEILQRLEQTLDTQQGQWAYDLGAGVNYLGLVFSDAVDEAAIRAHFVAVISQSYRIRRVLDLVITVADRLVRVSGRVDTDVGTLDFDSAEEA